MGPTMTRARVLIQRPLIDKMLTFKQFINEGTWYVNDRDYEQLVKTGDDPPKGFVKGRKPDRDIQVLNRFAKRNRVTLMVHDVKNSRTSPDDHYLISWIGRLGGSNDNKGAGGKVMRAVNKMADKRKVPVELTAANPKLVKKFYSKFGYVATNNPKDAGGHVSMQRLPNGVAKDVANGDLISAKKEILQKLETIKEAKLKEFKKAVAAKMTEQ